jgi:hypothetical protein
MRLESLVGVWVSEDKHYPAPWMLQGGSGKSRFVFENALDGHAFLNDYFGQTPGGAVKGHGIWFYDPGKKCYRIFWYDNFAISLQGEGNFDPQGRLVLNCRYHRTGEDMQEKHTFYFLDPEHFRLEIETWMDNCFQMTSELHYRRV